MCSWGKLWTTRYKKTKNPTATSEEPGAKAGYRACPLHSTPPKGRADSLSHPSGLTPGHTPTQLTPPQGASKGTCYLFSLPRAAAGAPIKPCLNFLSGFLSISIDWGWPRMLIGNTRNQVPGGGISSSPPPALQPSVPCRQQAGWLSLHQQRVS